MVVKTLLPGAWALHSRQKIQLFMLQVPSSWRRSAQALAQRKCQMLGRGYPSVPVYSLDPILMASFPQIVEAKRSGWQRAGVPWISATERIDLSDLPEFIKNWLREEFLCLGEDEVEETLSRLDSSLWQWDKRPLIYPVDQLFENPETRGLCFSGIPDLLATELLQQSEITFEGENASYSLTFYRIIRLNQSAELMSWPPTDIPIFKGNQSPSTEKVSFVISLSLQTLPWRQEPVIYHALSVRRWIAEPLKSLPYKGCSIYIGDTHRWLDGRRQPLMFMPIRVARSNKQLSWPLALKELLTINDASLPHLKALTESPRWNWERPHSRHPRSEQSDVLAAIAYHGSFSRCGVSTDCLPGVSPKDIHSLDKALLEHLPVERVGKATRLKIRHKKHKVEADSQSVSGLWDRRLRKTQMASPAIAQVAVLKVCRQQSLLLLIVWETPYMRDILIDEISKRLDTKLVAQTDTTYVGLNGKIEVQTLHISDLSQPLEISKNLSPSRKQQLRVELIQQRAKEITDYLPTPDRLSGAIIEIKPKHAYFPPETDPKLAWRIGAARQGYLNQHINPIQQKKKKPNGDYHSAQSAVLDLFRQLGAMPAPVVDREIDGVSTNLWLTCFHVLRRNRRTTASSQTVKVAIVVRVNAFTGEVQITTSSIFSSEGWLPYSVGILRLLDENWSVDSSDNRAEISYQDRRRAEQKHAEQFVALCLKSCLEQPAKDNQQPNVLLMASAQNGRELLLWLTNPRLPQKALPDTLKNQLSESECDRLWIVRIREHIRGEIPTAIAEGKPGSRVSSGGIFKWNGACDSAEHAIFLSFRDLLNSEQRVLRANQSRLDKGNVSAANPKPLEIALVHNPGIEDEQLAILVHVLRSRWPYFSNDVALPFPFPFAIKAKEYAINARDNPQDLDEHEEA